MLPWKKYEYQKLPIELYNSPDIFQQKMNKLFNGLDYVRTYIDDPLIISNKYLFMNKDEILLSESISAGFKVNAAKSIFARNDLEYLVLKQ